MKIKRVVLTITAIALMLSLSACSLFNNPTEPTVNAPEAEKEVRTDIIASMGEYNITVDELKLYLDSAVQEVQYEVGNAPGWETTLVSSSNLTARDEVINKALEYVKQDYAMLLEAKALGLYSEESNDKFVKSYVEYYGGEEALNQMAATYGINVDVLKTSLKAMNSYQLIAAEQCTIEEAKKQYEELYNTGTHWCAKHILIVFDGKSSEDEALAAAIDAYDRAVNGESFEALIEELGEDPGQDPATVYLFTEGEMVPEFEDAVKNLKVGEISMPVKTSYGYHVIKKYDIPKEGDTAYDYYLSEIRTTIGSSKITEDFMNAIFDKYTLEIDDSMFSKVDLTEYTVETQN